MVKIVKGGHIIFHDNGNTEFQDFHVVVDGDCAKVKPNMNEHTSTQLFQMRMSGWSFPPCITCTEIECPYQVSVADALSSAETQIFVENPTHCERL